MFSIAYKRSLTTLAVAGGLLIAAAPASAQRSVSDGTSNTVFSAAVADHLPTPSGYSFGASKPPSVACDGIGA